MNPDMVLAYEINSFQGAVLETGYLPEDGNAFSTILKRTLKEIEKKKLQLVWLYLPLIRADLVDTQNRILVIQERHHTRKHFKLPGGALDPGEHISHAVIREVYEETGILSEFLSINCFRHWHGYRYGKSDIYFVCRLNPLSSHITIDPGEISEARWVPVDEYLNHTETHPFNRKIVQTTLTNQGLKMDSIPDYGSPETHELMF